LQKIKALRDEELHREETGYYDSDLDTDDDETKELLSQAHRIKAKEDLMRMEFRERKSTNVPKLPRTLGRKRARTMDRLEDELGELGVDIGRKRMRNFCDEQDRIPSNAKKIRIGHLPSLLPPETVPRDEIGIPNEEVTV